MFTGRFNGLIRIWQNSPAALRNVHWNDIKMFIIKGGGLAELDERTDTAPLYLYAKHEVGASSPLG